jgi:starch-binding outer membrane protein, SusD/RagB family
MTLRRIVLLAAVLGMGACSLDLATNPNSPDPIGENPTKGQVSAAANGLIIALRDDIQDFALDIGILGREALRIDGSDPRWISELLIGNLDAGGDPFGGDHWLEEYTAIREGNLLLNSLQTAEQLTPEEISATSGFAKTIQALAFVLVLDTHTQDSIPIAIPLDVTAPPAPFVTNAAAWDHVITLLEEGNTELAAGGDAFPFTLPAGFLGFDSPATFATFNRALRARVAAYRADWAGVLTALAGSFLVSGPGADLQRGVYMNYGTGPGDFPNPLVPQTVENFAHDSLQALVQLQGDGVTPDLRFTTKVATRSSLSSTGFSSSLGFIRYPSPNSSVPIIKNEELILLRAEANINLSDLGAALPDINQIRAQSGGLAELPTLGTQEQAIDELLYNRLFSLLYEGGHRWIDLRRYGRLALEPAGDVLPSRDPNPANGGGPEVVHQTLPIPRDEVLAR